MTDDTPLIVHMLVYESEADLDVDYDGDEPRVANHDELVENGMTYEEVRAVNDSVNNRDHLADHMIVEPGDPLWKEEFAEWEVGDSKRLT